MPVPPPGCFLLGRFRRFLTPRGHHGEFVFNYQMELVARQNAIENAPIDEEPRGPFQA